MVVRGAAARLGASGSLISPVLPTLAEDRKPALAVSLSALAVPALVASLALGTVASLDSAICLPVRVLFLSLVPVIVRFLSLVPVIVLALMFLPLIFTAA